jgi:hypothetical protein
MPGRDNQGLDDHHVLAELVQHRAFYRNKGLTDQLPKPEVGGDKVIGPVAKVS